MTIIEPKDYTIKSSSGLYADNDNFFDNSEFAKTKNVTANYDSSTNYKKGDIVIYQDAFFEGLSDIDQGSTAKTPDKNGSTYWAFLWDKNDIRWQDDILDTQSFGKDVEIKLNINNVDSFAFLNVECEEISLEFYNKDETQQYQVPTKTNYELFDRGSSDWFDYFFGFQQDLAEAKQEMIYLDMPNFKEAVVKIKFKGQTAIGKIVVGVGDFLGETLAESSTEYIDPTQQQKNKAGSYFINNTPAIKIGRFSLLVPFEIREKITKKLHKIKQKYTVFIGDEGDPTSEFSTIYGRNSNVKIANQDSKFAVFNVRVEGSV